MTAARALSDLRDAIGPDRVSDHPGDLARVLRDNSWLSPVLSDLIEQRRSEEGDTLGLVGVAAPATEEEVCRTLAVAVRHRLPLVPRGSGTSNFGLLTPPAGSLVLDLRRLKGEPTLDGESVRAPAGTLQGALEAAASAAGRELTLLTTTYASATVAGWVAGGHVGLGSSMYGSTWDGNVTSLRVVTAEPEPRVLELTGDELVPLIHTAGTAGVITEVQMPTVRAREWTEVVVEFPDFEAAVAFVRESSVDPAWAHRVVTAQEPALMPAFRPLAPLLSGGAGVLAIIDRAQSGALAAMARRLGGRWIDWQPWRGGTRPSLASMVYGHRMLWVKKLHPAAAFLHLYFDPLEPERACAELKRRFGERVVLEVKYVRSPHLCRVFGFASHQTIAAAVAAVVDGGDPGAIREVLDACAEIAVPVQNPHTGALDDSGLFPDMARIRAFARAVDPFGILNPGKIRERSGAS
jgi:FAD/FMN-containing dehydrogenase